MITIEIDENDKHKLKEIQIKLIEYALKNTSGKTKAAEFLGISPRCLRDWISKNHCLRKYQGVCYKVDNDKWDRYSDSDLWRTKLVTELYRRK